MSRASTHFKLGLFGLVGGGAAVAAALGLGIGATRGESTVYHVYFDESVQGLEVGSPVRFRGVPVGTVAAIGVAPDHRHVDVSAAIGAQHVELLARGGRDDGAGPSMLRAQLGSQGITGVKFVSVDVFDPPPPAPALSFAPDARSIPSTASLTTSLERGVTSAVDTAPVLYSSTMATLNEIELLAAEVREERLANRLVKTLDEVDATLGDLRTLIRHVDEAGLPRRMATTLDDLDGGARKLDHVLDRLDGEHGLLASTQRATDTIGDVGRAAEGSAADVDRTLRDVREAAQAIRDLAQSVERDPDMLLRGRAKR